jgi:hypothetical protein
VLRHPQSGVSDSIRYADAPFIYFVCYGIAMTELITFIVVFIGLAALSTFFVLFLIAVIGSAVFDDKNNDADLFNLNDEDL